MGKTAGINLGLDFTILGQRLTGSVEYYSTTTKDLLYDVALPDITGFSKIASNLGKSRTRVSNLFSLRRIYRLLILNGLLHSIFRQTPIRS